MGVFDCDCACAAPPNTQPVADASKEATQIMAQLGREQLAEARRQFDINRGVSDQVAKSQLGLVEQTKQQGDDYFEYGKSFRNLEQLMKDEATQGTEARSAAERAAMASRQTNQANELLGSSRAYGVQSDGGAARLEAQGLANAGELKNRTRAYDAEAKSDINLVTGGNQGIINKYGRDIEDDVSRAVADTRVGQTSALNTAARQAIRYGLSVPSNMDTVTTQNAMDLAAAANNSRNQATDRYRAIARDGIMLKSNNFGQTQAALTDAATRQEGAMAERLNRNKDNFVTTTAAKTDAFNRQNQADTTSRNQRIQDQSLDWARKLDVTGMARGLPGASQGAYQVSIGAGNSAVNNTAQAGNSYLAAINQGVGTIGRGQELNVQGQSNILNALTSYTNGVNAVANNSYLGDVISAGAAIYGASDPRLKEDVKKVGKDKETGLSEYEFKYKGGKKKYRGVMADEVEEVMPEAVTTMPSGYKAVNYTKLGIEFKEKK